MFSNLGLHFLKNYLFSRKSNSVVKTISYISLITVSLAFFVFLLVLSVMKGLKQASVERYLAADPHIEVVVPHPKDKRIPILQKILKNKNVKSYHIFENQDLLLKSSEGVLSGVKALGLKKNDLIKLLTKKEDKSLAQKLTKHEILVGQDLAYSYDFLEGESLTAFPLETVLYPLGESLDLEKVSIKGFVSLNVAEVDSTTIFYVLKDTFSNFGSSKGKTIGIHIKLIDPYAYESLIRDIELIGFQASSWKSRHSDLFFSLEMEGFVMALFLALTGLLASFSISTVLSLLMEQKKREISNLQAQGLSLRDTRFVFFQVGFLLSFLGLVIGLTLSVITCLYLEKYPIELLPSQVFYDSSLHVLLTLDNFLFVLGVGMVMILINSYLPVMKFKPLTSKLS